MVRQADYPGVKLSGTVTGVQALLNQVCCVVSDAPKFDCANRFSAFPNSGNFTIECSIHSNPAVDGHSVHWSFEDIGINDSVVQINMYDGDKFSVYKANSEVSVAFCI